ncbi:uncharacterized protein E5676_scaffold1428G00330 [Cucumis melo var. makuwa]|nr:uncharacterized protein E5676_scaffold1428G00330 [Cucumis melo var. makuwa]
MDFITYLPKVGDFEGILVIIDRFSKYATFIPTTKQCSAEMIAQLFFKHVVKLWGVPTSIVSDTDGRFIGSFWTELFSFLGTTLNISSSYHPQTDGQTERFNCMLEEYFSHFVNARQKNWVQLEEPSSPQFHEGVEIDKRYRPSVLIKLRLEQVRFRGRKDQRLVRKYEGPVEVLKKVGNTSYRVALPTWMKIYPVIHVSNLKSYHQDTEDLQRNIVTHPIIDLSQKEDKDVKEILAKRVRRGRRPARRIHEYLVKWKNLPVEETSWERVENLEAWRQKIECQGHTCPRRGRDSGRGEEMWVGSNSRGDGWGLAATCAAGGLSYSGERRAVTKRNSSVTDSWWRRHESVSIYEKGRGSARISPADDPLMETTTTTTADTCARFGYGGGATVREGKAAAAARGG